MNLSKQRVHLIDGLRGFSLSGIILANMLIFQYGMYGESDPQLFGIGGTDLVLRSLLFILVVGSFMPVFAFMFGFGMVKLSESLKGRGLRPKSHLARRFLLLLVLGLLHSILLWEGDILAFYGLTGFFLLLFLNRKPRTLLIWSVLLLSVMGILGIIPQDPEDPLAGTSPHTQKYIRESIDIYGSGSYGEMMQFRNNTDALSDEESDIMAYAALLAPLLTAPLFLLGMRAARNGIFDNPQAKRSIYLRRTLILIPAGLLTKAYSVLVQQLGGESLPGAGIGDLAGGSLLALGYIYAFALLYTRPAKTGLLYKFEAVGRLSLTNYLMQSVICTTIFYGYGLGLFGRAGILGGIGIVLVVYAAQLLLSPYYLEYFRIGPVEQLLRIWTYLTWSGRPKRSLHSESLPEAGAPSSSQTTA
nr:DUF418 domain-containing protein [Paenibacillus camerounensis]